MRLVRVILLEEDSMHKITAALFFTALLLGSASASDELDVIRTVRQFIDFFNKGGLKAALNTCSISHH